VSQFLLFDKDFVGAYVTGASEEATRRYQLETLSNRDASEVARTGGRGTVSFMDGATRDKLRWADEVVKSHRAILGRPGGPSPYFFWVPYAGCHLLRERYFALLSGAQVYVHSEGAPPWVKKATQRYYALVLYPYSEGAPTWIKKANHGYWQLRHKYGFGILRYKYETIRASRGMRCQSNHLIRMLNKRLC
jgi:hypothetical protein